jgi:hypothetical protein
VNAGEVALRVKVQQKGFVAMTADSGSKIERGGGFPDAPLLIENGYTHEAL